MPLPELVMNDDLYLYAYLSPFLRYGQFSIAFAFKPQFENVPLALNG